MELYRVAQKDADLKVDFIAERACERRIPSLKISVSHRKRCRQLAINDVIAEAVGAGYKSPLKLSAGNQYRGFFPRGRRLLRHNTICTTHFPPVTFDVDLF